MGFVSALEFQRQKKSSISYSRQNRLEKKSYSRQNEGDDKYRQLNNKEELKNGQNPYWPL
jgi:hypothetical protein